MCYMKSACPVRKPVASIITAGVLSSSALSSVATALRHANASSLVEELHGKA